MPSIDVDLVVIGAGIQGVGVAQAAASMGYRVLLLEKTGIAAATSQSSSKLIHGGLRYLESGQFSLVRECLRERSLLLRIAPALVQLLPFYIPIYQQTRRRPWQIALGLSFYYLLSGCRRDSQFQRLSKQEYAALPGIRQQGLQAVFRYYDGQTDDRRLTEAVLRSAITQGARVKIPAQVVALQRENTWADGIRVSYQDSSDQLHHCRATCVVNAAGPWVNQVSALLQPPPPSLAVEWVAGTHLELNLPPGSGVFYLESPADRRAVFVMPWQGRTLIGTTERSYQGDPAAVVPSEAEIDYLLGTYNHYFPANPIGHLHIQRAFAGLRVLPLSAKGAFHRPRDTRLIADDAQRPRFVSVYGGKLTAYRATAERVMALLENSLPTAKTPNRSHLLHLE